MTRRLVAWRVRWEGLDSEGWCRLAQDWVGGEGERYARCAAATLREDARCREVRLVRVYRRAK